MRPADAALLMKAALEPRVVTLRRCGRHLRQLGVNDHLGIRQFFFFGNCIGGPFGMKLMERAPARVVATVLSQPVPGPLATPNTTRRATGSILERAQRS